MTPDIKATIARLRDGMAKATQGKWFAGREREENITVYAKQSDGKSIEVAFLAWHSMPPKFDEDARLIADAHNSLPVLLDALEDALRKVEAADGIVSKILKL